jgi:MFS family permease
MNPKPMKLTSWPEYIHQQSIIKKKPKEKEEPEYLKKEKSVNNIVRDGFFSSIKSGLTDSYIMPFAISLNASTGVLSILASVPQLVASFFQLFALESLKLFKTRSRLIVWTAFVQSLMWLPLIFIPFFAKDAVWLVVLFATLEATLGTFQGPIYNSIIGDTVPEDKRGDFFGKRNSVTNLMNFISTLAAGFALSYFKNLDINGNVHYIFFGYAILFLFAFACRATASYFKSKVYDPSFRPSPTKVSFFKFVRDMTKHNYGIFVLYVFLFKFAASISAPFFALYLLKDMHMSYIYYTLIMGASIVASFLSMNFWGKRIDKHGSKYVLTIAGFLVPLSPMLLILAIYIHNPIYAFIFLFVEELFSGMAWAAFNLSTSSFLFDATYKDERIKFIGYYNFLVGIAIFLGAALGGYLFAVLPIWIVSAIPCIFLLTGLLRLLSTAIMIKKVREARMVEVDMPGRGFFHNVISITPHFGSNIEIVGVYHPINSPYKQDSKVEKRKTIDPVKKNERQLYEKKSLEYYKQGALKTMSGKREETSKDDSSSIQEKIENDRKKISEITDQIRKDDAIIKKKDSDIKKDFANK